MALPGSQNQILYFASFTDFLFIYQNNHGTATVSFKVVLMEYRTSVKEASTKVIDAKMVIIIILNKSSGCQGEE